jgi:cell division protein FtsL
MIKALKEKSKLKILLALTLALPFFIFHRTFASEIDDLNSKIEANRNKIKEIEQSIADYKKKIEEARILGW